MRLPVNEVDMADGYVHIHIQLSCFGLTCSEECVKKVVSFQKSRQLFCFFDI